MPRRWPGRSTVLAIVTGVVLLTAAGAVTVSSATATLRVSLPDGRVVARIGLSEDGLLVLRYRNSLYGTVAEERFTVTDDGRLRLVALGAEQLAVLEEYYAIDTRARRNPDRGTELTWTAEPAHTPVIGALRVAATDRGERTLHVDGRAPLELWRFVDDTAPTVVLEVER